MIPLVRHISALTHAEVEFGLIPKEHWVQPPSIDEEKASAAREQMVNDHVIYGGACLFSNHDIMSSKHASNFRKRAVRRAFHIVLKS